MSEKTFIPNGPSFIGNLTTIGSQFSANLVAYAPTTYVRITNFGDTSGGGNFVGLWCLATANTAPQVVDFSATQDPAWDGKNNGTVVNQSETVILAIDNGTGAKKSTQIQFVANADPTSTGSHAVFVVQPVIPV